ncbi:hypothetical protein HSIEG1_3207 [Enterococcus sp. HSIEG1]|nr:hypothetical protein HSIEG1_3207 [Enterococcus sp. HSIEG1]
MIQLIVAAIFSILNINLESTDTQVVITLEEWSQLFFSEIDYNRDASIFIFFKII